MLCYGPVLRLPTLDHMCMSPIRIPNPNFGIKSKFSQYKDITSHFIDVPCGHCKDCVRSLQLDTIQRMEMEAYNDNYIFFGTLTYKPKYLPVLTTSTGMDIPYANYEHIKNTFKRIRNDNKFSRPFRHFTVSERGSTKSRPHFHTLLYIPRFAGDTDFTPYILEEQIRYALLDEWTVNLGSKRSPIYDTLLEYHEKRMFGKTYKNYDLHYVRPTLDDVCSSVSFYVLKYLLKRSKYDKELFATLKSDLPADEFHKTWNIVRSRWITSKYFGLGVDKSYISNGVYVAPKIYAYLRQCIERTNDFPLYYSPFSEQVFGLSSYYAHNGHIMTYNDSIRYNDYLRSKGYFSGSDSHFVPDDPTNYNNFINDLKKYEKILQVTDFDDCTISDFDDFLCSSE